MLQWYVNVDYYCRNERRGAQNVCETETDFTLNLQLASNIGINRLERKEFHYDEKVYKIFKRIGEVAVKGVRIAG